MALNVADTVFAGFNIVRREPLTVVAWSVAYVVFLVVMVILMAVLIGAQFLGAAATSPDAVRNPLLILRSLGSVFIIMIPLMVLMGAVLNCAVYRTVLRPEEKGFARMRLGADEFRMAGVLVLVGLMFILGYIVAILGAALIGGILGMALGFVGPVFAFLIVLAYVIWFYTYFSFAGPMTFARRKFLLFQGGELVAKRFWPLVGTYFLLGIVVVLLYLAMFGVQYAIIGIMTGSFSLQSMAQQGATTGNITAASLVSTVVGGLLGSLILPVVTAPAAVAYRDIAGPDIKKQADVFA